MNILYAIVIVTSAGPQMGPGQFDSFAECNAAVTKLSLGNVPAYCVKTKPVDIEKEMSKMVTLMKNFQRQMEKE